MSIPYSGFSTGDFVVSFKNTFSPIFKTILLTLRFDRKIIIDSVETHTSDHLTILQLEKISSNNKQIKAKTSMDFLFDCVRQKGNLSSHLYMK